MNERFPAIGIEVSGLEAILNLFTLYKIADSLNIRIRPFGDNWQHRDGLNVTWRFWVEYPNENADKFKKAVDDLIKFK